MSPRIARCAALGIFWRMHSISRIGARIENLDRGDSRLLLAICISTNGRASFRAATDQHLDCPFRTFFVLTQKLREAMGSSARPHNVTRNSAGCNTSRVPKCLAAAQPDHLSIGPREEFSQFSDFRNTMVSLPGFPNDFEDLMPKEGLGRSGYGRRAICESCRFIDVREWHRRGWLRTGQRFSSSWTWDGEPLGSIDVRTEADAVVLIFTGIRDSKYEQRVPLVWTKCHFGGGRCWFRCCCGRRAAILYMRNAPVFACRLCCGLAYRSQREIPRHRAISRAQKLRMRLGGTASLLERFPERPRGMHRKTYYRLLGRAMVAQERSMGLEIEYLHRRYPGLLSKDDATVGAVRGRK